MKKVIGLLSFITLASAFVHPVQKNVFSGAVMKPPVTELEAVNFHDSFSWLSNDSNKGTTVIDPDYKLAWIFTFASIFIFFLYPGKYF